MLEIKNLYVNYGNLKILQDITMKIGQGEIISLIGANGAGKTTLCRAISRLIPVQLFSPKESNVFPQGLQSLQA